MPDTKVAGSGLRYLPLSGGIVAYLTSLGHVVVGASSLLIFAGRQYWSSHVDGKFKTRNSSNTAGVTLDFSTDGKMAIRSFADNAPGELDCAGGSVKEVLLASAQIDLNITTKQNLYTVPAGKSLVVTKVVQRASSGALASVDGGLGGDASCSDWIVTDGIKSITATTAKCISLNNSATKPVYAATTAFGWAATTPEGAAATARLDVFGYLI